MSGGRGFARALGFGALLGLFAVAALAGYVALNRDASSETAGVADVVVILALPDEDGVVLPRVIDRYRATDGEAKRESVDPLSEATIPGTSYTQLREAYPFSGATGLVSILAEDDSRPSYVLIVPDTWEALAEEPITIEVPEHMEVFDGARLWTFEEGETELDADGVVALLTGADYLEDAPRARLREQVGAYVARRLEEQPDLLSSLETDLDPDAAAVFAASLGVDS